MAANDYFNPPTNRPENSHTPQPYYSSYNPSQTAGLSLPSYTSQPPSRTQSTRPNDISPVSPFEAPFDDHVYPAPQQGKPHPPNSRVDSQSTIGADSAYYGQGGGGRQDSTNSFADNIPLRDHPGGPGVPHKQNSVDHVYDASDPNAPVRQNTGTLEEGPRERGRLTGLLKKKQKIPFVTYILTVVQIVIFIVEIVKNVQLTGSPIMIKPQINPMIGPSPYVTINMGARYVSCMHNMDYFQELTEANSFPCPNTLARNGSDRHTGKMCNLGQLCGFNLDNSSIPGIGAPSGTALEDKHQPDQWFRFIVPIFLHAGIVHIGFNMLLQMTLGREMEMIIGSIRYFLVYFASGIFGFVLGGNFAAEGIASTGASGALFGILALTLLDLLYHWAERISPWKDFAFIMLDVAISFVLGLLPGLDNFSHIGGFIMGIALGICILHSPASLQKRIGQDPPYRPVHQSKSDDHLITGTQAFAKAPVGFFKGRKPAWWAWWLVRVASLVFLLIVFILLLTNFYKSIQNRATCSWCKYITCIDVNGWCDIGKIKITTTTDGVPSPTSTPLATSGAGKRFMPAVVAAMPTPF